MSVAAKAQFTIAAESANAHAVTVQLQTSNILTKPLTSKNVIRMYLSSDAAGLTPVSPVAVDVLPTTGTSGKLIDKQIATTQYGFSAVTDNAGKLDLVLTNAANAVVSVYLNVVLGNGKVITSPVIAFT